MHEGVLRIVGPCASQDKVLCIAIEFASNSWTRHVNLWHIHRMDWRDAEKKKYYFDCIIEKIIQCEYNFFIHVCQQRRTTTMPNSSISKWNENKNYALDIDLCVCCSWSWLPLCAVCVRHSHGHSSVWPDYWLAEVETNILVWSRNIYLQFHYMI